MPVDTNSPEYKKYRREISRKHRQAHPEKKMARVAGSTLQKKPCVKCLEQDIINMEVEAHHEDYRKPWDIVWLCKFHHEERDTELDRIRRREVEESKRDI